MNLKTAMAATAAPKRETKMTIIAQSVIAKRLGNNFSKLNQWSTNKHCT